MLRVSSLALGSVIMAVSAFGAPPSRPGTLSYLEGRTSIGSKAVTTLTSAPRSLQPGQILSTENGRAEILLIPGTYLRLSEDSAVRMVSPSLTNTVVELMRGHAFVDVHGMRKENRIRISERGASVLLLKNGLYRFDADEARVSVFDGKAAVSRGDETIELTKGHQAVLSTVLRAEKFDRNAAKDDLYQWSKLRAEYIKAENTPRVALGNRGWYGPGWYGDPWGYYGHGIGPGLSLGFGHGFGGHFGHH